MNRVGKNIHWSKCSRLKTDLALLQVLLLVQIGKTLLINLKVTAEIFGFIPTSAIILFCPAN